MFSVNSVSKRGATVAYLSISLLADVYGPLLFHTGDTFYLVLEIASEEVWVDPSSIHRVFVCLSPCFRPVNSGNEAYRLRKVTGSCPFCVAFRIPLSKFQLLLVGDGIGRWQWRRNRLDGLFQMEGNGCRGENHLNFLSLRRRGCTVIRWSHRSIEKQKG